MKAFVLTQGGGGTPGVDLTPDREVSGVSLAQSAETRSHG